MRVCTPFMDIPRSETGRVLDTLLQTGARKATSYLDENTVIKATAQHKPYKRCRSATYLLTLGAPNFVERRFIRLAKKAGEPFPIKKVQLKFWPEEKK